MITDFKYIQIYKRRVLSDKAFRQLPSICVQKILDAAIFSHVDGKRKCPFSSAYLAWVDDDACNQILLHSLRTDSAIAAFGDECISHTRPDDLVNQWVMRNRLLQMCPF